MNIIKSIPLFLFASLLLASVSLYAKSADSDLNEYYVDRMEQEIRKGIESTVKIVQPVYDSRVRSYLVTYLEQNREHTEEILGKAELYFPIIEKYLQEQGMPTDLKYLAIIESALEPMATSRVGAAGMWQFMRGTGIYMGLHITNYIDERRDPEKSTEAAVRYLKELYDEFGSWELAMSAYNAGPGRVRYAIRKSGSRDFWKLYKYLPRETRSYVPGFIAANYLFSNYRTHGLTPEKLPDEMFYTTDVELYDGMSLRDVNSVTGVALSTLRRLNPMYSRWYIPRSSSGYALKIPIHAAPSLLTHLGVSEEEAASITAKVDENGNAVPIVVKYETRDVTDVYRVVKGDNLYKIAQYHGCSVDDLIRWNKLQTNLLSINQKLVIKSKERVAVYAEVAEEVQVDRKVKPVLPIPSLGVNNQLMAMGSPDVYYDSTDDLVSGYSNPETDSRESVVLNRRMSVADVLALKNKSGVNSPAGIQFAEPLPGNIIYFEK